MRTSIRLQQNKKRASRIEVSILVQAKASNSCDCSTPTIVAASGPNQTSLKKFLVLVVGMEAHTSKYGSPCNICRRSNHARWHQIALGGGIAA